MFTKNRGLSTDLSTSIPHTRKVFAIFVHFGPSTTTNAAIDSLLRGSVFPDRIVVVDHGGETVIPGLTRDPRVRQLADGFQLGGRNDTVTVIRPKQNTGYFGGLQAGIEQARTRGAKEHDLCLLLNNDVVFFDTSLANIIAWWRAHGAARVLAAASLGYVSLFSGRAHIISQKRKARPWNIPYVHGSCMIGEFGFLSSLDFPQHFFLYWEDVALSILVQRIGGHLAIIPGLSTLHNDSITPVSLSRLFYLVRNGAYVLEHSVSLPWRVYWYTANTLRFVYHTLRRGRQHKLVAQALHDARAGILGKADI